MLGSGCRYSSIMHCVLDVVRAVGGHREQLRCVEFGSLRVRESLHLSSHTGLMQVLPGLPLADPKRECQSLCRKPHKRQRQP